MLQIYIGDGKGKTTAAIGAAVRAAGAGYAVIYARFMKSRPSSELEVLRKTEAINLYTIRGGYPFFKDMTEADKKAITEEHNEILAKIYEAYKERKGKKVPVMVICDEYLHALNYGLVDTEQLFEKIEEMASYGEVILTGRRINDEKYHTRADYITRMDKVKHPYDNGVTARKGIEY